ncbi:hypothetical protein FLO80_20990 [Aquicoccus porphyridii]|uniref:Uncharacterized protein n=1 Tax=Aquicoccus porphyridii TaxID=1852029 RepID=A0A5A9YXM0_9RHOB|nr:hypothetical protein [Aquicoccus porphyridii]KAA0909578.1 hypothetical protein FLO80_20990 [Aquicoccus porphyridii]RAI51835.1 hypothetical protein DOO74_21045 [Rhodobacteraceae bacterium AsT-22]
MAKGRLFSAVEAVANVAVGWGVALGIQLVAFPVVGLQATVSQHAALSGLFTAASLVRSYVLRRLFLRLGGG